MFWRSRDSLKACVHAQRMLSDHSVGRLSAPQQRWLESHLNSCPQCMNEQVVLRRVLSLVDSLPAIDPPLGLWDRIEAQIAPQSVPVISPVHRRWRPIAVAAATSAALLAAFGIGMKHDEQPVPVLSAFSAQNAAYIEGHALVSRNEPFADRVGLVSFVTMAGRHQSAGASDW